MELQITIFPFLLSSILFLLMFFNRTMKNKKLKKEPLLPPGPWRFPLFGNIPQLAGALPCHRFSDLARIYGPVMSFRIGQIRTVVISSPEAAKEVLKTHDVNFVGRPIILAAKIMLYDRMDITFGQYGDNWRQLRRICTSELLSAKRVRSFRPVRAREVSELVDFLRSKSGSPAYITRTLFAIANTIMAIATNGEEFKNQETVLSVIEEGTEATAAFSVSDVFPSFKFLPYITGYYSKLQKLHKKTDKVLEEIIEEHKAKRRSRDNQCGHVENFLDVLLDLQQSGKLQVPLTNDSIKATILQMFGGGSNASYKTTEWEMSELMRHPLEMRKVQEEVRRVFGEKGEVEESRLDELEYLKFVIKETLRLHPLGPMISRECNETRRIHGYDIQPKTQVLVNVWAINRDPNIWKEPERFYPERFRDNPINYNGTHFEFIPFGAGKRICPAITLTEVHVELFLATLLYHFDWVFPPEITAETLDMSDGTSGVTGRKIDLNLVPISFSP